MSHHHFVPPVYLAENRDRVSAEPQKTLEAMNAQNVSTAVLSLPLPGVWFGDAEAARRMLRLCSEYAVELARSHRCRFGLFPVIALPDTEASLREIEYAFDVLKADGIGLSARSASPLARVCTRHAREIIENFPPTPVRPRLTRRAEILQPLIVEEFRPTLTLSKRHSNPVAGFDAPVGGYCGGAHLVVRVGG
jgi:hypothetical protein